MFENDSSPLVEHVTELVERWFIQNTFGVGNHLEKRNQCHHPFHVISPPCEVGRTARFFFFRPIPLLRSGCARRSNGRDGQSSIGINEVLVNRDSRQDAVQFIIGEK